MPAWPAYARIEAARDILATPTVERTQFDDGAVRQERRLTQTPRRRRLRAHLTGSLEDGTHRTPDEDLERFMSWAVAYAHKPFDIASETRGAALSVRVIGGDGGISYAGTVATSGRRIWQIDLEVETL